jgi:hypothetical protein
VAERAVAYDGHEPSQKELTSLARLRLERFMGVLTEAVAAPEAAESLCKAGVRVRIDLKDLPDTAVSLLLDKPPARVIYGDEGQRPDVQLWMWSADLEAVLYKGGFLPLQILSGAVEFEGYVRKFLRVLPILTAEATRVAEAQR